MDLGIEATGRLEIVACVEKSPAICATIRSIQQAGRLPGSLKGVDAHSSQLLPMALLETLGMSSADIAVIVGGPPGGRVN